MAEALARESDRGAILVSAAYLDQALESLLRAVFSLKLPKRRSAVEPLFDALGPLATFSAKIKIAFALDLIPEWEYNELEALRKLRNHFAHTLESPTLDSPKVLQIIEQLKTGELVLKDLAKDKSKRPSSKRRGRAPKRESRPNGVGFQRARVAASVGFIGRGISNRIVILQADMPLAAKYELLSAIDRGVGEWCGAGKAGGPPVKG